MAELPVMATIAMRKKVVSIGHFSPSFWLLSLQFVSPNKLDNSSYVNTSNGGCRREEKSRKHWSFFTKFLSFVTAIFFYLFDQIKSYCMYWLHWKSEKNRTEPNELDELKYSKSLNQMTSYAHWHAFLYLHAYIKTLIYPI